jgi:beta-N-acetylhexosaminidase
MTGWELRPYDPTHDRSIVDELWRAAIAPVWPVLPKAFEWLRGGFVAIRVRPVGFVGVDPVGSIPLLVVDPATQSRGCGTALLDAAVQQLRTYGATDIDAGSGGAHYVWPGVPLDLAAGVRFFTARGWTSRYDCLDLTQDLRDFRPRAGIVERSERAGVRIAPATVGDRAEALAFEAATFPQWSAYFESASDGILVARDPDGRIVGTLLYGPEENGIYAPMLGPAPGSIGCVGVAPDRHNAGIGSALVARASELLRDAHIRRCHIGWAVRDRFYGRVGYRPWRRYRMFQLPDPTRAPSI